MPFLSGLGSSAPQTLPTSSATGSSLLGGGLFSGFGMSSAPTDSTGTCGQVSVQVSREDVCAMCLELFVYL